MTVWSPVLIGSLTESEQKETQGHECGPEWLFRDRYDPGIVWCRNCGACLGCPGGVRRTVPLDRCFTTLNGNLG